MLLQGRLQVAGDMRGQRFDGGAGSAAVAVEGDVVGDARAEGVRCVRINAGLVEHQQAGAEAEALAQVVGDHKYGELGFVPQLQQQAVHVLADAGVEGAEGLIEQQHARLHDQRLGDGQPLLHAAGELAGVFVQGVAETDLVQNHRRLFAGFAFGGAEQPAEQFRARQLQADGDVVQHTQVREHRVALKYHATAAIGFGGQRLTTEQTPVGRVNALLEAVKELLAAAKGPALNLANVAGRTGLIVGLTKMLNYVVRDYVDDALKMGNTPDAVKAWWVSAMAMIGPSLILIGAIRNGLNGTGSVSSNLWRVLTASMTVGALIASHLTGTASKTLPAMVGATLYSVLRDLLNTLFPLKDNAAAPSGMNTGATAVIYGVSQYILAQVGQLIPTVNGSGLMPNLIRTSLDSFGLVLDDVVYMLCRSCDWLTGASMPEPPVAGYEQERDRTLKVLASAQVPDRHQCANTAFNIGGQRMAVAHAFTLMLPAIFSILQTSEVEDPQGLLNLFIGFMCAVVYLPLVFGTLMRTDRSYTLSETPTA